VQSFFNLIVRINDTFCDCLKENPLKIKNNATNNKAINRLVKKKLNMNDDAKKIQKNEEKTTNGKNEEKTNGKSEEKTKGKMDDISAKKEGDNISLSFKLDCGITMNIPLQKKASKIGNSLVEKSPKNLPENNCEEIFAREFSRYKMKLTLMGNEEVEFYVTRPGVCFSLDCGLIISFFL
jgi:hypothetical protein